MENAVDIWNLLWDYQIQIALMLVFLVWIVVRGSDLIRWAFRKRTLGRKGQASPAGKEELPDGSGDASDAGNDPLHATEP
ncbi:MAG: hypothetical protein RLZZ165_324 [Bacteroidota bacterium]